MAIEASKSLFKTAILIRLSVGPITDWHIGSWKPTRHRTISVGRDPSNPFGKLERTANSPNWTAAPATDIGTLRTDLVQHSRHLALRGRANLGSRYATEAAHSAPALQVRSLAYRCRFRSDVRRVISVQIL